MNKHNIKEKQEYIQSRDEEYIQDEFIEMLTYFKQNNQQLFYEYLKEHIHHPDHQVLIDFIDEVETYIHNIEELGSYNKLEETYNNTLIQYKQLLEESMDIEEFKEYMEYIIPYSILNKGHIIVEENNIILHTKNKTLNINEQLNLISDYFKYTIELKDPYHILIKTPLTKLLDLTMILDNYNLTFELIETNPQLFIYQLELPYLSLDTYEYKILVEDHRIS